MKQQISFTTKDIGLIELALETTISTLKQRFENEIGITHPALKYELLYDKISEESNLYIDPGWIPITGEADLPPENSLCWICTKKNQGIIQAVYFRNHFSAKGDFGIYPMDLISHYQIIKQPGKPGN